jgi:hypothetical protein
MRLIRKSRPDATERLQISEEHQPTSHLHLWRAMAKPGCTVPTWAPLGPQPSMGDHNPKDKVTIMDHYIVCAPRSRQGVRGHAQR